MNHTAYDFRLVANNVNRATFTEIMNEIEAAAVEGKYQLTISSKRLKLPQVSNLVGYLTNIGFQVTVEAQSSYILVSWLDQEKKIK